MFVFKKQPVISCKPRPSAPTSMDTGAGSFRFLRPASTTGFAAAALGGGGSAALASGPTKGFICYTRVFHSLMILHVCVSFLYMSVETSDYLNAVYILMLLTTDTDIEFCP